jgi:enoyl-CoA hydratase/carnithine racemase
MVTVDKRGDVAVVALDHGTTNPIGIELIAELSAAVDRLEGDASVAGLVLSSSNEKFFCIGWDIPGLFGLARNDFERFFDDFERACLKLYAFPRPTVAALTGHATAGGCILATCCDYRFIAEGRKLMGLNEIRLGVPVPYFADCILRDIVGAHAAREMMEEGGFYDPQQSLRMGLVDRILPVGEVIEHAVEKAGAVGASPRGAFAEIKGNRVEEVQARAAARRDEKRRLFLDCWFSQDARRLLKEAMAKF